MSNPIHKLAEDTITKISNIVSKQLRKICIEKIDNVMLNTILQN